MGTGTGRRRTALAGMIGNVLEWYDFAVYGFFAATIGKHYFPSDDPRVSVVAAFGVFAIGFLARPVGGLERVEPEARRLGADLQLRLPEVI